MSFEFGGGADVPRPDSFFLVGEFKRSTRLRPQLTVYSDRRKWQMSPTISTGVAIHF